MPPTVIRHLHSAARRIASLVFPPVCIRCGTVFEDGRWGMCRACLDLLDSDEAATCPHCAATTGQFAESGCGRCRKPRLSFDNSYRLGEYRDELRRAILTAKGPAGESMGRVLGKLLGRHLAAIANRPTWNMVVPVPTYWVRRLMMPFHHADVLAEEVARALHVRGRRRILRQVKYRPPQTQVSRTQRFENVRGVFDAPRSRRLRGAVVLVVDDVMTTGATADEATRCLKQAGAARVDVAIVGRTVGR